MRFAALIVFAAMILSVVILTYFVGVAVNRLTEGL